MNKIPEAVMRRLPRYYRHLSSLENNGIIRVSSKQLGESLLMTASQIRHDLNFFRRLRPAGIRLQRIRA